MRALQAVVFLAISAFLTSTPALAEESDFDGDGVSDVTLVAISNGVLNWTPYFSTTGTAAGSQTLGENGNHIAMANWLDSAVPELGVVFYDSESGGITWSIKTEASELREVVHGSAKDFAVGGADLDGSGFADAVTARRGSTSWRWSVYPDPFVTSGTPQVVNFGSLQGRPFYLRLSAERDVLAVITPGTRYAQIRTRDLATGETRQLGRFPLRFLDSAYSRPFPVRQADGTDILGFRQTASGLTRFHFRRPNGALVATFDGPANADAIVGEYLSDAPGREVIIKAASSESATLFNPVTKVQVSLSLAAGIAVDSININRITDPNATPTPTPTPGSGPSACRSVRSWPSGHIYKTVGSTHFSPADPRRYTAGVVMTSGSSGPFPSCLTVRDTSGRELAKMGLYQMGNGWAARYYAGWGCGSSTKYGGAQLGQMAQSRTGSKNIYIDFGSVCSGPINATICIGSSQC